MALSRRSCLNHPDIFCYICGSYASKEQRKPISAFVKRAYFTYFGVRVGDQDKQWAPHIACKTYVEHLHQWINGKRRSLQFGVPTVWREPKNHHDDCYFCMVNIMGINRNNRRKWIYSDLESVRRPVPHSDEVSIPVFDHLTELIESSDESISSVDAAVTCSSCCDCPYLIIQDTSNYHNCLYGFNQLIKHNTKTYTKQAQLIQQNE